MEQKQIQGLVIWKAASVDAEVGHHAKRLAPFEGSPVRPWLLLQTLEGLQPPSRCRSCRNHSESQGACSAPRR